MTTTGTAKKIYDTTSCIRINQEIYNDGKKNRKTILGVIIVFMTTSSLFAGEFVSLSYDYWD